MHIIYETVEQIHSSMQLAFLVLCRIGSMQEEERISEIDAHHPSLSYLVIINQTHYHLFSSYLENSLVQQKPNRSGQPQWQQNNKDCKAMLCNAATHLYRT